MLNNDIFKKHIAVPQDHGSWVFIISPLLIGVLTGKSFTSATFALILAVMAAFMLRQPAATLTKILSNRRVKDELFSAIFWMLVYVLIVLLSLAVLIAGGFGYVIYLAIPGIPVFAWYLRLVGKREERKQMNIEIVATGVLSLSAPAAYWVGIGQYDPTGWWLWILVWFQTAASIVYAYLRLSQRRQTESPGRCEKWRMGWRAALYTSFNLASVLTLSLLAVLPSLLFVPYLVQWVETMWGMAHPATGWKPTRIGVRQLIVSTIWTILFIVFWR